MKQRDVMETIKLNSRLPLLLETDLDEMVAAADVAEFSLFPGEKVFALKGGGGG